MAHQYKLIDASATSGGGGGNSSYSQSFTTLSWNGPSSGEYSITILQSTHEAGADPIVQVFESNGGVFELVDVGVSINSFGDVTINVSEVPDNRFSGRVVII